jgi:hypothetical protein
VTDKETTIPKIDQIRSLPRWACVAFAAQCARNAEAVFNANWPTENISVPWLSVGERSPSVIISQAVDWTTRTAEERTFSGHYGHCDDLGAYLNGLASTAREYGIAAAKYAAECCHHALDSAGHISPPDPAEAAQQAANAVGKLAEAAGASSVVSHRTDIPRQINVNYNYLINSSLRERWDNDTAVNREFFSPDSPIERQVIFAINDLCVELCRLIAKDKRALWQIEWRLLEQVIATALEGLGFDVVITPPSKDGGKDVVACCLIRGLRLTYYIEIKHWRSGKRVGEEILSHFVEVNLTDGTTGGLLLSTSGFVPKIYSMLAEISQIRIRLGGTPKIISLCQRFVQKQSRGIWLTQDVLPQVLLEEKSGLPEL